MNDAGAGLPGRMETRDPVRIRSIIELNSIAPVLLTRTFLPPMLERDRGAFIILASIVSLLPAPFESVYCATKAFNLIFGESLWGEMRGRPIDVLNVCPTATRTGFWASEGLQEDVQRRMAKRSDSPEDIARLALRSLGRRMTVGPWSMRMPVFASRFLPRWVPPHFAAKFSRRVMKTDQVWLQEG
ncbi:MAG: SDR family NAD(P)-dependent oxidoreductase [Phycisphaerae bacterium]|nr:SDR family NAD(P)-dependent oxidoreductase [Phycisphaerae bacterium]